MISHTTGRFRKLLSNLQEGIKKRAREAYTQFKIDPYYPGLHFKRVHSTRPIYSVQISRNYPALGIQQDYKIIWFWIGSHSDYTKILSQLRQT